MTAPRGEGDADTGQRLSERLRTRLLTSFHLGRLQVGDRLPSVRQLSREWGADPRQVMRAYHALEVEGLVEVRDRSGAYLAIPGPMGPKDASPGTVRWMAELAMQSWSRRLSLPHLRVLVERCLGGPVRCILMESAADPMAGLAGELTADFGIDVTPMWAEPDHGRAPGHPPGFKGLSGPEDGRGADLVVTTSFHAASAAALAERLQVPLSVVAINPEWIAGLETVLGRGGLTTVAVDPGSEARFRRLLDAEDDPRFRFEVVSCADELREVVETASTPVYVTRAVRDLVGHVEWGLTPTAPLLGPASARELVGIVIRLNLARFGEAAVSP